MSQVKHGTVSIFYSAVLYSKLFETILGVLYTENKYGDENKLNNGKKRVQLTASEII